MLLRLSTCLLLFSCSTVVVQGLAYNDTFARDRMSYMCSASYSGDASICLKKIFTVAELVNQYFIQCDPVKNDYCSAFLAVAPSEKAVIMAFRGTSGNLELITEIVTTMFAKEVSSPIGGTVSQYFYDAFFNLWSNTTFRNDFIRTAHKYPTYQVWITGHSLGGAMASIAASTVVKQGYVSASAVRLYTFGQPRTGDLAYATAHNSMFPYAYRVVHKNDIVPHLPPHDLYPDYQHHISEVWYDNDMTLGANYTVCGQDESKKCSDGQIDLNIQDHLHYFNREISGDYDCKTYGT